MTSLMSRPLTIRADAAATRFGVWTDGQSNPILRVYQRCHQATLLNVGTPPPLLLPHRARTLTEAEQPAPPFPLSRGLEYRVMQAQ